MLFWIKLAFKNIFRNRQRTFLTLLPIIFGVTLLIVMFSLLDGLNRDSINNLINYESATLKIVSKNFSIFDKKIDINKVGFIVPDEIVEFLKNSKLVESFTPEIIFTGDLSDGINRLPVLVKGIDFSSYKKTFKTLEKTYPKIDDFENDKLLIGSDLLKYFEINFDSILIIQSRTSGGTFDAFD
ncbi:TPA: hypothetical protein DCG82_04950, partial [candidate division WOR-3]|nr:hypothetical protein [candidate division WOR-3 bacterium]